MQKLKQQKTTNLLNYQQFLTNNYLKIYIEIKKYFI